MTIAITRDEFVRFAPNARAVYVDALFANLDVLKDAGIMDTNLRLAHFFAQVWAETGGLTILRESMAYSVPRLREVFPARYRNQSDAALHALVRDPVKLGDSMYGGRMGNRKGTGDGYDYRGGGWLQTTGKGAVEEYARELGMLPAPELLDNQVATLQFAATEWRKTNCNKWADLNDVVRVSKIINTGSAESGITPNGMDDRREGLRRALAIWGNAPHLAAVSDVQAHELESRTIRDATSMQKVGQATTTVTVVGTVAKAVQEANVPAAPPAIDLTALKQTADGVGIVQKLMEGGAAVSKFAVANWWIAGIVIGLLLWWYGRRIVNWYLEDIRTGKRTPVFKVTAKLAGRADP